MRNKSLLAALLGAMLISPLLAGCATRTIMETNWELPGYAKTPYEEIAVIGVLRNDASDQRFEHALASELEKADVDAVPGYTIMKTRDDVDQEEMEKIIDSSNVDAVLISRLIAVNRDFHYVPPTAYDVPPGPYADWWTDTYWGYYTPYPYHYWGYWHPAAQVVVEPGYWDVDKNYRVETALYSARDQRLVWTATSRTFDPMSEEDLASSLGSELVERLEKAGIVRAG